MLKIALLQLVSAGRDVDANLRKGDAFCRRAAAEGAEIALFPEMWSIGDQAFSVAAPPAMARHDPFVQHFRGLARELRMAIAITYLERWRGSPRDSVTLFDRNGREVLTYAKMHLGPWDPPDNVCTPGDGFRVAQLDTAGGQVQVGFMICFDREFPEAARMLALNGAELILTPNACELAGGDEFGDVRIAQFRARAFENLAATAMANYAAPQNDGNSIAVHADGHVIVRGDASEGIVFAEVDLEQVRALRQREIGRDEARRPEHYSSISRARLGIGRERT